MPSAPFTSFVWPFISWHLTTARKFIGALQKSLCSLENQLFSLYFAREAMRWDKAGPERNPSHCVSFHPATAQGTSAHAPISLEENSHGERKSSPELTLSVTVTLTQNQDFCMRRGMSFLTAAACWGEGPSCSLLKWSQLLRFQVAKRKKIECKQVISSEKCRWEEMCLSRTLKWSICIRSWPATGVLPAAGRPAAVLPAGLFHRKEPEYFTRRRPDLPRNQSTASMWCAKHLRSQSASQIFSQEGVAETPAENTMLIRVQLQPGPHSVSPQQHWELGELLHRAAVILVEVCHRVNRIRCNTQ